MTISNPSRSTTETEILYHHAPALGDRCIGDGLRQRQRYVLLGDDTLCAGWR
jgi:hypothetical protein